MKKFLLVMCAVIGLAFGASAQRAQLQIGYGGYTQMDASDMHDYGAVNNAWGALTAGVNFKILPSFSLGLSYTFSSTSYKHIDDANAYYHVFMLNGKYDYWRNSIVRLYAHAGVGVDVTHMAAGDWHKTRHTSHFRHHQSELRWDCQESPRCLAKLVMEHKVSSR